MSAQAHMDAGRFAHHGGRLCVARSLFPGAPQPWVDLSTGINPRSYPAPRASSQERNRLPEPTALARLEAVAAAAFGVADPTRVVATGGTECALRLLPHVLNLKDATIAGPTYGSHTDAWARAGAATRTIADTELATYAARTTALTIVNPNNPDGRMIERQRLLSLHDSLRARAGALIVDEAFGELAPAASVADVAGAASAAHLIVLRSFGKFFGLAGIRLGFIIAAPHITAAVRHLIGEWPVSSDALVAGLAAYTDVQWADRTRKTLQRSARRLDHLLIDSGFEIAGGTSLYRLARAADARSRFAQLLAAGILVRPFDYDHTLLRFGLPRGRDQWQRLTTTLASTP